MNTITDLRIGFDIAWSNDNSGWGISLGTG